MQLFNVLQQKNIDRLSTSIVLGLLFFCPLIAIPLSSNFITNSKIFLVFLVALVLGFLSIIVSFIKKRWEVVVSPFTISLFLFGTAVAISTFFTSSYPVESLLGQGGFYLATIFIAIIGGTLITNQKTDSIIKIFSYSAGLLAISSLFQFMGFGPSRLLNILFNLDLPNNLLFNLSGSSFIAVQIIVLALIGLITYVKNSGNKTWLNLATILILIIGLGVNLWSMLPGKTASISLPNLSASFQVATKIFQSPKSALIGFGPESYSEIYTKFKPISINSKSYWQFSFGSAINSPLTIIVTYGIVGLLSWLLIVFQVFMQTKDARTDTEPLIWILAGSFLLQLLLPSNLVIIAIQAVFIALLVAKQRIKYSVLQLKTSKSNQWVIENNPFSQQIEKKSKKLESIFSASTSLPFILSLPILLLIVLSYLIGRAFSAYYYSYLANKATLTNDAVQAYDLNKKAAQLNPYLDTIRRQYALVNLQIAIALSNNKEISEEDKNQITPLVSQAISEAKAATFLNSDSSQNWLVLAEIYKNLIGSAEGADQWALDSLVNAAQQNPIDPITRVEIGHLFFNKGQYEDANSFYTQAIQLKPDLAMGYYHLGRSLVETKEYEKAKANWNQALSLLDSESEDYMVVKNSLEELKTKEQQQTIEKTTETTPNSSKMELTKENTETKEAEIIQEPATQPLNISNEAEQGINQPTE